MLLPHSILLATDFQPASHNAASVAMHLAEAFHSRTTAINVIDSSLPPVILRIQQAEAESMLEDLRANFSQLGASLAACHVLVGPIADAIAQKAVEINADLVVLGAGVIGERRAFVAGPIAQAVMEQSPQPVLLVHPKSESAKFRTIICPVDHSAPSLRGLRNAIRLAQVLVARLVVLSVIPEVSWITAASETGTLLEAKAEYEHKWCDDLDTFLKNVSFEGVAHEKVLREGIPHEQIVAVAREQAAELIVMGATGRTGLVRVVLGSTTRRVLRDLPCSLLTVKHEDVVEELLEDDLRNAALLIAEGRALYEARSYEAAIAKLRRALSRNPFHVPSVELLADAFDKLGSNSEARRYRRRAEQLRSQA